MRLFQRFFLSFMICFFLLINAKAQDIEAISKGDILSANGGISFTQTAYHSNRLLPSRKPYSYLLTGNVNLKILGFIDAPFTFLYSNLGNQYTQPTFNQTSLHPKYKWVQLHLGTVSGSWSPYTLNGHVMSGGIAELTPGKWNISALYGRFVKATQPSGMIENSTAKTAYQRNGMGMKLGYNSNNKNISANLFYAKDQISSILPDSFFTPSPMENLSGSLQSSFPLLKKLQLKGDLGMSLLNQDLRVNGTGLRLSHAAAALYNAYKLQADWAVKKSTLTMGWERIDPNYRTLGAYYFNNNLENITIGAQGQLFKGALRLQGSLGKQKDNLDGKSLANMKRTVGNGSAILQLSKKATANLSYSNFLSFTNLRSFNDIQNNNHPYARWDTLNFRQISQNFTTGFVSQIFSDSVKNRTLMLNATAQTAVDRSNGEIKNGSLFVNGVVSFATQWKKSKSHWVAAAMVSRSAIGSFESWAIAPSIAWGLGLFRSQIKWMQSLSYTMSLSEQIPAVFNLRSQVGGDLGGIHHLHLSVIWLQRSSTAKSTALKENTIQLTYSVNTTFFDTKKR